MKAVWTATGIIALFAAFHAGRATGLRDCPEHTAMLAERAAQIDSDLDAMLQAPTGREAACDTVFRTVRDELDREALDDQAERARTD